MWAPLPSAAWSALVVKTHKWCVLTSTFSVCYEIKKVENNCFKEYSGNFCFKETSNRRSVMEASGWCNCMKEAQTSPPAPRVMLHPKNLFRCHLSAKEMGCTRFMVQERAGFCTSVLLGFVQPEWSLLWKTFSILLQHTRIIQVQLELPAGSNNLFKNKLLQK